MVPLYTTRNREACKRVRPPSDVIAQMVRVREDKDLEALDEDQARGPGEAPRPVPIPQ